MNKQETIEAIKVMQAFVDGKTIESNRKVTTEPNWFWGGGFLFCKARTYRAMGNHNA